jgi:copper chaperone CopZ
MKKCIALLLSLTASISLATDETEITYEGKITGVVCAACKAHVTAALSQKLPGFVSVDVKPGEPATAEEKKLIIVTKNADLTKETVITALGTYAKNYQVISLEKKS